MPEFEDIRKIASARSMPLSEVRSLIAREREEAVRSSKPVHEDCEAKLNLAQNGSNGPHANERDVRHHVHHHPHSHGHDHSDAGEKENDTDP